MGKRGKKLWILLGVLAGCPCLLTGLALVGLKVRFAHVGAALPDEIAAARQAGMPTEPDDLRRELAIPQSDNAAVAYEKAFDLRTREAAGLPKDFEAIEDKVIAGKATAVEATEFRRAVGQLRDGLEAASKAAQMPRVDWNRHWEAEFQLLFPEYSSLRFFAKALAGRAILNSRDGHVGPSLDDIQTMFGMANHAGQEPMLISFLVQASTEGITENAMEKVLNAKVEDKDLDRAAAMIHNLHDLPNPRFWLGGELVMQRQTIHSIRSSADVPGSSDLSGSSGGDSGDQGPELSSIDWLLKDPGYRRAWEAKAIHYVRRAHAAIPERNPSLSELRTALGRVDDDIAADNSLENKFNQMFLSVFANSGDAYIRALAKRRMMAVSIAALKIWKSTGTPPSSLPDLGSDSIDPFSSRPLGYKHSKSGFKVYSVDADLADDGGLTRQEDKSGKSKTHDIAFSFGAASSVSMAPPGRATAGHG